MVIFGLQSNKNMSFQKSYLILFTLLSILTTNTVHAAEIFSCKLVAEARLDSESVFGRALYGESSIGRQMIAATESKVLILDRTKKMTFGGNEYSYLGISSNYIYADRDWGMIEEIYDSEDEVTLFATRSNGYNSQKSNFLEVELWHCNK